jgi:hypothetical protein
MPLSGRVDERLLGSRFVLVTPRRHPCMAGRTCRQRRQAESQPFKSRGRKQLGQDKPPASKTEHVPPRLGSRAAMPAAKLTTAPL